MISGMKRAKTATGERRTLILCALVLAAALAGCKSSPDTTAPDVAISDSGGGDSNGGTSTDQTISIAGAPDLRAMAFGFYEFVPQASHAENQSLTFRIEGKPAWARFDARSGTLAGIPSETDVGQYAGITVFASDGVLEVALPAFAIEVYVPPLVSATLAWLPPTHRLDGTVLDDLAGYTVRYGTNPYRFPHTVEVPEATAAGVMIENIPAERVYFFEVQALDAYGKKSPPSQLIEVAL